MRERVKNVAVRYYVSVPLSWFEISRFRQAARQQKKTLPKLIREKLGLDIEE